MSRIFNITLEIQDDKKEMEVIICRFKDGAKGALCVSIDFDLLPSIRFEKVDQIFREATLRILQLAKHYTVSLTWGICGDTAVRNPELFQQIVDPSIEHDLGAHTFRHIDLSDPACSNNVACSDIRECIEVLKKTSRPVSFIFPKNREGHILALKKLGFISYRGNQYAKMAPPFWNKGLWDIHQTYYLNEKSTYETNVLLKLLDLAISYGGVFHVWSHPWNMHIDGDVEEFMERVLTPFFEHATKRREEGFLWICTMRELANYSEAKRNCHIETPTRKRNEIKLTVSCQISDKRFDFPPAVTLKIPLPKRADALKVFVDEKEAHLNRDWHTTEMRRTRYVCLTLLFENPTRQVLIRIQNP